MRPIQQIQNWMGQFIMPGEMILDVGCGEKRYWDALEATGATVMGIDAWEPHKPHYLMDLNQNDLPDLFDVYLLMDLVEHFDRDRGKEILRQAMDKAKRAVVVLTPLTWNENHEGIAATGGNGFNLHRCLWEVSDFKEGWQRLDLPFTRPIGKGRFKAGYYMGVWHADQV